MYVGSHYQWKKQDYSTTWWKALQDNPHIEEFCRACPGAVVYGEIVPTQKFKYGMTKDKFKVFIFDVLDTNIDSWQNFGDILNLFGRENCVPVITKDVYHEKDIRKCSDGPSTVSGAGHIREGIVIRPVEERSDPRFGRVILKIVSVAYLGSKSSE